ncbi:MAG: hypothetical protein KatS3mg068_0179 [Candidatus Sericytochromatia bacterium]|nr:MAG: hypothetical protein KatS3mg068_0179 [Candidatus Sericytochromatia bacterium]
MLDKHWNLISTSKNIEKHKSILQEYRNSLKEGDITLLGLITDGGVGLQTGNNGKYIGVLENTKLAYRVKEQRTDKLFEFSSKNQNDIPKFTKKTGNNRIFK